MKIQSPRSILGLITLFFFSFSLVFGQDQVLIPLGSTWKFLDDGSNQGTAWKATAFNDASWASGPAELGYGEGDENTVVSYGSNSSNKHVTTYFRHSFSITDINQFKNFLIRFKKDDGALVYVNGQNVMRSNFGTNTYDYNDLAYSSISGSEEDILWEDLIDPSYFQTGTNVIAVEVHQYEVSSSDLSFDLELTGLDSNVSLYRKPYLQKSTPSSITIKWKTDVPTDSRVNYWLSGGAIGQIVDSLTLKTNHEVTISNLDPNTLYEYVVGNQAEDFTPANNSYSFKTNPVNGTDEPTRIWVTGDAGTGKSGQLDVRDAYLNYIGPSNKADLWLMMGDNAYEHGRESDYQMGLFDVYDSILRNTVSFPTSGNHDFYGEATPVTQTGPYFDIFALPTSGESGGIASGTEAYYSYDYGNIHFISLESYQLDRDSTGIMATWLKSDLQNTTAKWTIAYWHYAPYTKVGHDSDDPNDHSGRAIEMRENINPILEQYDVDLVLSGHSHGYERSYLLNGHYGYSWTLTPDMKLDSLSGRMDGTGAYYKPKTRTANSGAVYVVCGSSGKLSSHTFAHPAMYTTNSSFHGSMVIDVEQDTLEGKFLNENGIIQDYFHLIKGEKDVTWLEETIKHSNIKLGPNPTTDNLYIHLSEVGTFNEGAIQIFASNGELVKIKKLRGGTASKVQYQTNVADLPNGIYTVKVILDNQLLKSRLLVVNR